MADGPDVGLGPRLLAIETVLRALVDQASSVDPTLRDRIKAASEAYLATVLPLSELEHAFTERSRDFLDSILRPPAV